MIYGHHGTIHNSTDLDVEVDKNGKVVSVWFRCMALPFRESIVDDLRADQMRGMYRNNVIPKLLAVDVDQQD